MMFDDEAEFASRLILLTDDDASEKSIIFSPTSILMGLALFYVGCDGETATEIEKIIGKGKSENEIIDQFSSALNHYKQSHLNMKENVKVKFANKVFISNLCKLFPTFCQTINTKFDGGFQQLNFNDNEAAALEINNFVKTETNGLIQNMVDQNDIDLNTFAILVNAVHFKAPWTLLFEEFKMVEFESNSKKRIIKMMSREVPESSGWNYVESENWTCLGIPYEKYKAWIYFILPNENYSLKELLKMNENENNFRQWTKRNISPFINVTIPFIDVKYEINMNEKLKKLGIETAFTEKCNATKMTKKAIFLKKVFHKSTITVNEMGTEASAASSCFCYVRSARKPKHTFLADRPFLYFITTIKEPVDPSKPSTINYEDYYDHSDFEDDDLIDVSEYSTEPFNLLFVGTFC